MRGRACAGSCTCNARKATQRARRLEALHAQLTSALFRESNPAPLKYALSLLGLMSAKMRLPLVEPTEMTRREIATALANVEDRCPDYMITSPHWLTERVRAAAIAKRRNAANPAGARAS